MRELKIMTTLVYICTAGVVVSFGGGIYTAVRQHQEDSKPHPSVFPTPAALAPGGLPNDHVPPPLGGAMPTPAH